MESSRSGAARVALRDVTQHDLPIFFRQQRDEAATRMAAFTSKNPADETAFNEKWRKILLDESTQKKTIVHAGQVVGHIASFELNGKPNVTYWIGREYWGRGFATDALLEFLRAFKELPLHASAASDNLSSLRVLIKCGFSIVGRERAYANARGEEIEEVLLLLT